MEDVRTVEDLATMKYVTRVEDKTFTIEVQDGEIVVDGQAHDVDLRRIEPLSLYSLLIDNLSHEIYIEKQDGRYGAMLRGQLYDVDVQEEQLCEQDVECSALPAAKDKTLIAAPMPSLVLEVPAAPGQNAQSGDVLVVLESMKMRTELRCPQDGTIRQVHVAPGDHVAQGQLLVHLSPQH
jgi:biotin carboxyl carrier protein